MLDIEAVREDRLAQDTPEEALRYAYAMLLFGGRYARSILLFSGAVIDGQETPMTEEEAKEAILDFREKASQSESLEKEAHWDLVATTIETYIK